MLKVRIFTLYPDLFPGALDSGIYKKARKKKLWDLEVINIRDYAADKHSTVDENPFGGGNGMLMRADVLANALDNKINYKKKEKNKCNSVKLNVYVCSIFFICKIIFVIF